MTTHDLIQRVIEIVDNSATKQDALEELYDILERMEGGE